MSGSPEPNDGASRWHWQLVDTARLQEIEGRPPADPYVFIERANGHVLLGVIGEADGPLTIGRHAQADLPIQSAEISRRHAIIENGFGLLWLTDAGSANGTFVNGTKIVADQRHRLKHRDTIRIADTTLRVRIHDVSGGQTRRAAPEPDWRVLTPRQRQFVLTLIELWPPTDRIQPPPTSPVLAEAMGVSRHAIKDYLSDIYDRLEPYGIPRDREGVAEAATRFEAQLRDVADED